jgi:hypothetical protein
MKSNESWRGKSGEKFTGNASFSFGSFGGAAPQYLLKNTHRAFPSFF